MSKINLLDSQVANLIAAGEVVERPASAIKELLENSIDARANKITVEIKNGGVSLMRITDNGCGMTREDAIMCIRRHATSKIKNASDLDGIMTLGFRGEALAAIASVSAMRIMTRTKDDTMGTVVTVKDGSVTDVSESGCPLGTTIMVEELFSNVPARRKFLKRDATETASVCAVVEKIALSHPEISIKLITDGLVRFQTAGDGALNNVIYSVLGRDFAKKTVSVHDMTEGVEVEGVIGTPENVRGNRGAENFFINGRYIRCGTASAAIEQAFNSYIPSDKFPSCVLNIKVNPAFVDVNVHPQKLEVKFSNDKPVFNAVYCAVKNALTEKLFRPEIPEEKTKLSGDSYRLYQDVMSMKTTEGEAEKIADDKLSLSKKYEQIVIPSEVKAEAAPAPASPEKILMPWETEKAENVITAEEKPQIIPEVKAEAKAEAKEAKIEALPYFRVAGVAFNCYVFVELEEKMLIIDKHAAHERVLFENMRERMSMLDPATQLVFMPIEIPLSYEEYEAVCEYRDEMSKMGFDFTKGENGGAAILGYPSGLTESQASDMFSELALRLSQGQGDLKIGRDAFYEKALYQASCKAAVKGGREDSPENIKWIVEQVLSNSKVRYCPHGRPVAFEMTKKQFENQFERT